MYVKPMALNGGIAAPRSPAYETQTALIDSVGLQFMMGGCSADKAMFTVAKTLFRGT